MWYVTPLYVALAWSLAAELIWFLILWLMYRAHPHIFFDPQDYFKAQSGVKLPERSEKATFEAFLTNYMGMAKLIIGLAAASISFGGLNLNNVNIFTAKMLLAWSIAFALGFCVLMTVFYENYLYDSESYKPWKCALVESFGLASLSCFILGYGYWAWHL
jgi:hypothetical protein